MLPPEMTRNGHMCMSQFVNLLSCCRIPSSKVDTQRRSSIDQSCHIIIAHNGHVSIVYIRRSYFVLKWLKVLCEGSIIHIMVE